ncbi:MAG: OmpA family protein [Bacteroidota bacterium]
MRIFKALFLVTLLGLASCMTPYQKALSKFEQAKYNSAIPEFEAYLLENPEQAGELNYLLAESYRRSNRVAQAIPYYEKAIAAPDLEFERQDSARFYYAYALKAAEQYELAEAKFQFYADSGENYYLKERASKEVTALNSIDTLFEKKKYFNIYPLDSLNSPAADFSPMLLSKDELVFTSSRRGEGVFETTGEGFQDLYLLKIQDQDSILGEITPFAQNINFENVHEASATFSPDGKTMIFARSGSGDKKDPETEVSLYISKYENNLWSAPRLVPGISQINEDRRNRWESTPFLAENGTVLYFSSNRSDYPNEGGLDLFRATLDPETGDFINIENLGDQINTAGNELFPYVDEDGTLYFASDGQGGLGGLDIYRVLKNGTIQNLGRPVNSGADDFGLIFRDKKSGFFCSNRQTMGEGNDDIYLFVKEKPPRKVVYYLQGIVYSRDPYTGKKQPLANATVKMDGDYPDLTTDANGKFVYEKPVQIDEKYELRAEENTHLPSETTFSTVGKGVDKSTLKKELTEIYFDTELTLTKNLLITGTDAAPPEIEVLYELDSYVLTPEAEAKLDQFSLFLKEYLKIYPDVVIEMGSHTDVRGGDDYNLRLSRNRAKSAVDYLLSKGISEKDIQAKGYGETEPKILNARTKEEHQLNRRTTIKVFKKE